MANAGVPIIVNPSKVSAKNYDNEASALIKGLTERTWKSARRDANNNPVPGSAQIKSRCIGVLDATMDDQTHKYIIACSSTGLNDMVVGEEAKFADVWGRCKGSIKEAIGDQINCIVADVGPSTQCYCAVPSTKPLSEFVEDDQKDYWKEIDNRMRNRKRVLDQEFLQGQQQDKKLSDAQLKKLKKDLKKSVFGVKFAADQLPKKDFEDLVVWHKNLIENPVNKTIKIFIELAEKPYEEVIPSLCAKEGHLKGKEELLKAATDPWPKNKDELPKRLEILGLRHLDREGILLPACQHVFFKPNLSRLADYFAQCAEDNATIELMKYLRKNPSKKVKSVDWFSTAAEWSEGGDDLIKVKHKPLCAVCAIRFKDRLEWLLSSQDNTCNVDGSPASNVDGRIKYNKIFINNTWYPSISGDTYPTIMGDTAKGNEKDVDKAVAAGREALQPWGTMKASAERGRLLNKLADLIEERSEYLACLETMGNRRPLPDKYLPDVVDCYRYFAWWAIKIHGGTLPDGGPYRCFTNEQVGLVGLIISGDFPLLMQAWTLGPALSAGNTVVIKPAKANPFTSLYIASLIAEAGFPPGVVNIVTGDGNTTGTAVATHPKIKKVVFVGSTEVGHQMLSEAGGSQAGGSQAGGNSLKEKKLTMMLHKEGADICKIFNICVHEGGRNKQKFTLSGKGSTIIYVLADADLKDAVEKSFLASYFRFSKDQPLPCTFVEKSKYKEFVKKSLEAARKYYENGTWKFNESTGIMSIEQAGTTEHLTVMHIMKCVNFEVINPESHMYDIAAAIFTTNVENAMKLVKSLNASTVWVNCYDAFCHQAPLQGMLVPSRRRGVLTSSRDIKYNKIFIKNTWYNSTSRDTYPIINPSTGDKICDVAMGNKEDVDFAVAAAHKALQPGSLWGTMEASQRGKLLKKLADLIERDSKYLAHLEAMYSGRPIRDVGRDQPHVISCYRYFAEQTASQKTHKSVAIVGHIISGDFPLLMQAKVLGSALCAGNTVILKPAEQTPLSSLYVASLTAEAGFPPGVVSILPGVGSTVGDAMKKHPDISFTGHPNVHKNPIIVFADADLDYAIENSLFIITVGPEGQCIRPHTYVQESVYETFVRRSVEKAKMIKVGNPLDPANDRGPLVDNDQLVKTLGLIESAVKEGANLQCGGQRHGDQGYFIEPTILSDVTEDMQIAQEEIFGPVMLIMKFKTIEEVTSRTNNPIYNSKAVVFTTNDETKMQFLGAVNRMRWELMSASASMHQLRYSL